MSQYRGKGRRLQQLQEDITSGNAAEAQDPGGHRGTDVGAYDHMDGLLQGHQLGVNEANHHNRSGRRTLDYSCNTQTGKQSGHFAGGELADHIFQLITSTSFQSTTHNVHAEKEQTQAADQG